MNRNPWKPDCKKKGYLKYLPILFWLILSVDAFGESIDAALPQVSIRVRDKARVRKEAVVLGDIAEITAPSAVKEKLAGIRLVLSPRPGREKCLTSRQVVSMVAASRMIPADVKWTVPESICIDRAFQRIETAVLQQLYEQYVREHIGGSSFKIHPIKALGTNQFPTGKLAMSIAENRGGQIMGRVNLQVSIRVDDAPCGRLVLSGWVDRFSTVVCARQEIKHHTILTSADLILKPLNVSEKSGDLLTDMADAVGKQTRSTLPAGACLRSEMLTSPPLVRKGDQVKIIAGSGKLSVSTLGIAKRPGGRGDQIPVENVISNKIVVGRVVGEGTVEVNF